jgi:ERCC4-type nuclease
LSLSFYALNVYIENIKHCFESFAESKNFSGLFIMRIVNSRNFDQQFHIVAELALETKQHDTKQFVSHILKTLPAINSEYGKLLQSIGKRAHPKVSLVPYGKLDTIPGKKHRWVRKG